MHRYEVRPFPIGWAVWDTLRNEPAEIEGDPLICLTLEEAQKAVAALATLRLVLETSKDR